MDRYRSIHGTVTETLNKETQSAYGGQISQTALHNVGVPIEGGPPTNRGNPEYAQAVSLIFTKATNQAIILGSDPKHVLSTSILWNSLLYDKRFKQVPMSEAAPGDIIMEPGWQTAPSAFAGIVVDHGRVVSNSSRGVQNNSSLVELQRSQPAMITFRYIGVQAHRGHPLANANFNSKESRIPAGRPGGGQWTTSDSAAGTQNGTQNGTPRSEMAPATPVLSGGNRWTSGEGQTEAKSEVFEVGKPTKERAAEATKLSQLAEFYLKKAQEEDQEAALALAISGMSEEYERDKASTDLARSVAAELQRRAYILENGMESIYRQLMLSLYGINNPELNKIAAYYAEKFNDQATLNWLKLQHPAEPPTLDANGLAMMLLFPELEKMGEASQIESGARTSPFDQATESENTDARIDETSDAAKSGTKAKSANLEETDKASNVEGSNGKSGSTAAAKNDYRATFFAAHPELKGQVIVHHAVEQQVLTRYPGLFTESEINSIGNLRGVPTDINSDLHLSRDPPRLEPILQIQSEPNAGTDFATGGTDRFSIWFKISAAG